MGKIKIAFRPFNKFRVAPSRVEGRQAQGELLRQAQGNLGQSRRIAINGFGRIGRLFFRAAFADAASFAKVASATKAESAAKAGLEIVAINDLGDLENLAYLLKYDSVYRVYERQVTSDKGQGMLIVDGKKIKEGLTLRFFK